VEKTGLILEVGGATRGVASATKTGIMKAFGENRVEIGEIKRIRTKKKMAKLNGRSKAAALLTIIAVVAAALSSGCGTNGTRNGGTNGGTNGGESAKTGTAGGVRVVSTVPSVTETLFALGLGDSVVAASTYCQYPPEVADLPKIGSLFDINIEAIVELDPDFVVVLQENEELAQRLTALGVETVAVDHSSLAGVLASFETLGAAVGGEAGAESGRKLRRETENRLDAIRASVAGRPKPSVLIAIDRTPGLGKIADVFVAAQNPYFNEALEIVGATNAAGELRGAAPVVSPEGIAALNPDVVVDLSTDGVYVEGAEADAKIAEKRAEWATLDAGVKAVKNGRVYPVLDLYATVPGPRTVLFLEKLADSIWPERAKTLADEEESR